MSDPRLYIAKEYKLNPNKLGERLIIDYVYFDTMYLESFDGDSSKVWIAIDDNNPLRLSFLAQGVQVRYGKPSEHKLVIRWDSTNDGKTIVLVFGRDIRTIMFRPPQGVRIIEDSAGLAKDFSLINPWYRSLEVFDGIIPSNGYGNLGGNMYWCYRNFTIYGVMIMNDDAILRILNEIDIEGELWLEDNSELKVV